MKNFMKLFAVLVLFVQIQVALSQPNLVEKLCKGNRYQALCVSTLNLDPRSKTSSLQGLASISIDATTKKTNDTLTYLISVLRDAGGDREKFEKYGTCVDQDYGASVDRYLPKAMANLKANKYSDAISNMQDLVSATDDCLNQFAGHAPVPLSIRNKAVHDIADMTIDIIKTFVK